MSTWRWPQVVGYVYHLRIAKQSTTHGQNPSSWRSNSIKSKNPYRFWYEQASKLADTKICIGRTLVFMWHPHLFRGQVPIFRCLNRQDSELPLLQDRGEPAEAPRAHRAPWWRKENGDVELRNPRNMCDLWMIYGWFMDGFWMIYGWFRDDLYMFFLTSMIIIMIIWGFLSETYEI